MKALKCDSVTYIYAANGSRVVCFLLGDEPLQVLIERLQKAVSEKCFHISKVRCSFKSGFSWEVPKSILLLI